ncbi:phosphomannomutase [Shewanella colwelliana]|uniref:phosphomannomutase n=1 Tax=Shewanella colwelliana TaxID=23 RepID=UPI0022B05089|nr:phosphomannomutase [Shewanella colwelliana]MCZ4336713.1 phosphomannomutase [Shewanella colwelliana]
MTRAKDIIKTSNIEFGTSGARGLVNDFSPQVSAAFAIAFLKSCLDYRKLAIAIDNRPSSPDIALSCISAAKAIGVEVEYYGVIPTPALANIAILDACPAIMVTGSHIPFDRNGLKFYRPSGEISKTCELEIVNSCQEIPNITFINQLPSISPRAEKAYVDRYLDFFPPTLLSKKRIGLYEHSSAGRDIYKKVFQALGANIVSLGRSDDFVPIDTEAVSEKDRLQARNWCNEFSLDSVFSTDGDGDRPLLSDQHGNYLAGDILGLLCASELNIQALSVPVNCNTSIEMCKHFTEVVRTKIGSPFVLAEFSALEGKYKSLAGFEANGGFMLGSNLTKDGKCINALPTRDALLPALIVLSSSESNIRELVARLPQRYTFSDRITNYSHQRSSALMSEALGTPDVFLRRIGLSDFIIDRLDETDGVRFFLHDGSIVHIRASGNAPELRCYVETNDSIKSKALVQSILSILSGFFLGDSDTVRK